jgi:hypothetical protein
VFCVCHAFIGDPLNDPPLPPTDYVFNTDLAVESDNLLQSRKTSPWPISSDGKSESTRASSSTYS